MDIKFLIDKLEVSKLNFVDECLFVLKNEDFIVFEGNVKMSYNFIDIYYHRDQLQKIQNKNLVLGYDDLLKKIKFIENDSTIKIISVQTKSICYIIFLDEYNVIVSILKSLNSNIGKLIRLINEYSVYDNSDYKFYIKSKKVTKKKFMSYFQDLKS